MRTSSQIRLHQNVEIYKNKELVHLGKNLVITSGQEWIAERMITDAPPAVMSHMAIGTTSGFSANLVTNGDMELDANWNDFGSPTSNVRSVVQFHDGSYSRAMVLAGGAFDGIESDAFTTVTGQDVFAQAWVFPTATTTLHVVLRQGDGNRDLYHEVWTGLTAGAWNKIDFSIVEQVGGANAYLAFFSDNADTIYIDGVTAYNSVALAETTLTAELSRLALTGAVRTNNYVTYSCDWVAGVGTGAIVEAGIFNAAAAGTMLSRIAFPVINKLVDDSMSIVWRVFVVGV